MQYLGKVLELRGVECIQDQYYALVRFFIGDDKINFKWQLDEVTGENLKEIIESSQGSKFRLSLFCYTKQRENGYYSSLSKLTGEITETIYFSCSENYAKNINWISNLDSIEQLGSLKTTEKPQQETNVQSKTLQQPTPKEHSKPVIKNLFSRHIKLGIATGVTVATLLGFSTLLLTNSKADTKPQTTVDATKKVSSLKQTEASTEKKEEISVELPKETQTQQGSVIQKAEQEESEQSTSATGQPESQQNVKTTPTFEVGTGKTFSLPPGYVAITFDDGPSPYTKQIVDTLNQYEVGGTFFFIGEKAASKPELVRYAYDNGLSVANHSMTHTDLRKISSSQQEQELLTTNDLLSGIINKPVNLFRPPYGAINDDILNLYSQHNTKTILWNQDPKDWEKRNTSAILNFALSSNGSGSIYVFHEIKETTEALPKIIEHLQSQGLKIVSLK